MTQVARKLGLRVNRIYKWTKQLEGKQGDAFSGKRTATDKSAKIRRLNKALAAGQEENEFLKKRPCSLRRTSHEVCSDSPMPPPILGSDITFIPTRQGWLYLAVIIDLYSRAVIGWAMHKRMKGRVGNGCLEDGANASEG
jgi:transposase InsO family protein